MPIVFSINKERGFIISNWMGIIDDEIFITSFYEMLKKETWEKGLNHIADLTGADISNITTKGIIEVATIMKNHTVKNENGETNRVAVVAKDKRALELTTIYQSFFEKADRDVHVFDKIDEALEWFNRDQRGET